MSANSNKRKIVGVGSALVDILSHETDDFLNKISDIKGGMTLVEEDFIRATLLQMNDKPETVPGGAACNTIVGIAQLGGDSKFIGKRGDDELGSLFEDELKRCRVKPELLKSSTATGRVLSIITPDAQRSMFTYLGASAEMVAGEISSKLFENAAVVLIEGYLLFNRDLMFAALKAAKKAGALVAMDLASFNVVEASMDILPGLIESYVDILIANEDEATAFTGSRDEAKAIEAMAENVEIAVLKVGKKGSYISRGGDVIKINPMGSGDALDTTGAGDLWAAGFLYGFVNGYTLERSGELGSACGHAVCQVLGASISDDQWTLIKKML